MENHLILLFLALLADRFVREPDWLWAKVPHPVVLFGKAIDWAENLLLDANADSAAKRRSGAIATFVLVAGAAVVGWLIAGMLRHVPLLGWLAEIALVAVFLAQRSLADHVGAVADGLRNGGLQGGRKAVSMIVGRDPDTLDEAGVCRAAIESLAENTSDGIVAPAFWYALAGLPGLFAYKMLNTADSMIGHRSERYLDFGQTAAITDDLANWIPARLTGLMTVVATFTFRGRGAAEAVFETMMRDARLHRSPNAGWPEAAFAAFTGLALAGPRIYDGAETADSPLNASGRREATTGDIEVALSLFWRVCGVFAGLVFVLAILL